MYEYEINTTTSSIWDIPPVYQLYWSPLIATIYHNHMLLLLIKVTLDTMFNANTKEYDRVQLAGWADLLMQMILKGKYVTKSFCEATQSEWRPIIKTMMNQIPYFKEETFMEVINKSGVFPQKKVDAIAKLIKLRTRDTTLSRFTPMIGENTAAKHLIKTDNNLSAIGGQINNCKLQ